jgi:glyoxylase-like metal-dependent hydrolase (beta-lactamase superfamily II)/uncharacterized protein with ACT and thioredoxin-like domain
MGNEKLRHSFIIRVPDEPGSLHRAAGIVTGHQGNINRLQFDRRIDLFTVFFEISATDENYGEIARELEEIGYLRTSLRPLSFLKIHVYLPHEPGALSGFLTHITASGANIAYIDFDDSGQHPERLTMSLNLEESPAVDRLLQALRSQYRLDVLEYDTTGRLLDDTVFYLRFAQEIRELTGESGDKFLLSLLGDINHIVQELAALGKDPKEVFGSILATGKRLSATTHDGFYAEIQRYPVGDGSEVVCIQPPCGGNVFLFRTPDEVAMIDSGYGCYYRDFLHLFRETGLCDVPSISRILVTHGDADHCGSAGLFSARSWLHPGTMKVIEQADRSYGSASEGSILDSVYTTIINLFSAFSPPPQPALFRTEEIGRAGIFPVIDRFPIGGLEFEVLEGLGGHLHGQVYFLSRKAGLLFSGDTLINHREISAERTEYNSLAVFLVTSVNMDSAVAKRERKGLIELVREVEAERGGPCLICGGHGPLSVLGSDNTLRASGTSRRWPPDCPGS